MSKFNLSNRDITQMCGEVEAYLKTTDIASKEQIRIVFAMEEVLLQYQTQFGQGHGCVLRYGKELGRTRISMSLSGEGFNPFATDDDTENSQILRNLLNNMGLEPTWQYSGGRNVVFWVLPKKKTSAIMNLVIAIGLAVVLGLLSYLVPTSITEPFATWIVTPLFNSFMGILVGISGPLIFLSVAWGIYSIGDIATFGHIGKVMIGRFMILTMVVSLVGNGWMLLVYPLSDSTSSFSIDAFYYLFQMILDIIPGNMLAPFVDSNPMQIICLAVIIGFAILILGKKTTVAATFLEQASFIIQYIMECISTLVPSFIFISVFNMFLNHQFQAMATAYKAIVCMVICAVVVMVSYGLWVAVKCKVSFSLFVKKLMPTFIIGVTTDSSSAAFATNVETCEQKLGIDTKIVNFGLPLGQVVYMPGALILFMGMALFMAESYEVDITLPWLLMAFIVTCMVSIAAPPIPGSPLTCYTLIFTQLGIPTEAVAVAIVLNVMMGCLGTGVNLYGLQCELTLLADQLGMLNKDILRKK